LLADLIIRAKQTYASVAGSRDSEGHHVRECTAGTQKTSREDEDNERAIGGAILETHSIATPLAYQHSLQQTLHERLKNGKYQAQPLRGVYIPKENGKQRPISIPALEDKIVQKATVEILNAIYEHDFLDCSYGFRPGRGQHQALDEVGRVICTRPTGWILELDITAYLDSYSQCSYD
jgi:hypothetical protein